MNFASGILVERRIKRLAKALVIAAAATWIYGPGLRGDWVWDDNVDVLQNPVLQNGSGLWSIWFEPGSQLDYYPIKATVQWAQWQLWGAATPGYHLTNLVLHIAGALLAWRLLAKLELKRAWLGALIFTVHPAQVESVQWIAELKNTLSLPLFLLSAIFYLDYDADRRGRDYAPAVGFFLAAMLTKPVMVMFPLVLLLYAWWKRGRLTRGDARAAAPFFVISLVIGLLTLVMGVWYRQGHHVFAASIPLHGFLPRVALAGTSLAFYLWTVVWPVNLSPLYPQWRVDPPAALEFLPWLVLGAVVGWLWVARQRGVLFGLGFFVLMLAPFVGPVSANYMNFTWVMDHFLYLPILGLIGLGVAGVEMAERRAPTAARYAGAVALALAVILLAAQSRDYAAVFAGEGNLWSRVVERDPGSWLGHNNLGNVLVEAGRFADAEAQFNEALRLKPGSAEIECNLGINLLTMGRPADAVAHFEKAARLDDNDAELHSNWGVALARLGQSAGAIAQFNQALKIRPGYAEAHYNLGEVLFNLGRFPEAAAEYGEAARLDPDLAQAQHNWGLSLARMGQVPESIAHYREAVRLNPAYAEAQSDLADALLQTGQPAEALEHYPQATGLNPPDAKIEGNWGYALAKAGHPAEAISHYEEALRLQPGNAFVQNNWGDALAQQGQLDAAIQHFQEALRLNPAYAEAHNNLAIAFAQTGRNPDAVAEFQKALQIDPNYVAVHNNLGITLSAMGRKAEAQRQFEAALKIDPGFTQASDNLKVLQEQKTPSPK